MRLAREGFDNPFAFGPHMSDRGPKIASILLVVTMLLAGCTASVTHEPQEITGCTDSTASNFDPVATTDDGSCTPPVLPDDGDDPAPEIASIPHTDGCDNTNPIHCMLPFPSDAFLTEDESTVTGVRMNYAPNSIPGSSFSPVVEVPIINQIDGVSPSSQIMTAFSTEPDVSELAGQYTIGKSLEANHPTKLLNRDTGELIPHWVELDARSEDDRPTILHIRTIQSLDHDTSYAVLISGLTDSHGVPISAHEGFTTLRDGVTTDSPDIENRRSQFVALFAWAGANTNVATADLQAAWQFHTASTESIIGPLLSMRNDALDRIGNGLGCTVESNSEVFEDGNRSHWLITGTYTAPQYTESFYPPALIQRAEDRTPIFVENREIPFWLLIPSTTVESGNPAPLTIWGHGFLGDGNTTGLRAWSNENNVAMLGTSFYGWASDDFTSIEFAVLNMQYFQHQSERLEQAMINQVVMVRTFMGACSDLSEYYHNGTKLIDTTSPTYTGYSNGALRGPSVIGLSPDLNRGVLWAGGSAFSQIIERCTQYDRFYWGFSSEYGYPDQMDRAIGMSVLQSLWDSTETDTFLYLMNDGYGSEVAPFELMTLFSIGDFQISNISSSRMMRTGGIPLLDSSTITPYGLGDTVSHGHTGSVGVFFDGGYEHAPEGNTYGEEPHPAHNSIGGLPMARLMAFHFLSTGTVDDTCEGTCVFSPEGLSWSKYSR